MLLLLRKQWENINHREQVFNLVCHVNAQVVFELGIAT